MVKLLNFNLKSGHDVYHHEEDAAAGDGDDAGEGDDDVGDGYGGGDDYWYDNGDHGNSEIMMMTIGITIRHILFC